LSSETAASFSAFGFSRFGRTSLRTRVFLPREAFSFDLDCLRRRDVRGRDWALDRRARRRDSGVFMVCRAEKISKEFVNEQVSIRLDRKTEWRFLLMS
jgi:hypothetical protein